MTDPVNRPVRLAALAGVAALGLVLAGCSGDAGEGEPSSAAPSATSVSSESASPDASSSASPSPSASGSFEPATETSPAKNVPVPEMPEAAKEPTEDGLEALLEYWWETEFYLKATGDSTPIEAVSTTECVACTDLIDDWEWAYGQGGWVVGEPARVDLDVAALNGDDQSGTHLFTTEESATSVYKPDGILVEEASSETESEASWSSAAVYSEELGHWAITDLRVLDSQP